MAQKSKARSPTKPAAKKAPKTKEKTQRERFIEAAREIGVDETGKEFERLLNKVVIKTPPQRTG